MLELRSGRDRWHWRSAFYRDGRGWGSHPSAAPGFARCGWRSGSSIRCPPGNCKLQTLRQYYRLPERGVHTALGDVCTVADLFATVLRPIAEQRGLEAWEELAAYAAEEWFPSGIAFGQPKGRSIAEARTDAGLRRWLDGLAQSANARNARMGRWYLRSLEAAAEPSLFVAWQSGGEVIAGVIEGKELVLYVNPELQRLRTLVESGRTGGWRNWKRASRSKRRVEAGKIAQEYRQANAQHEQDYAETAAALAERNRNHLATARGVRFIAERWVDTAEERLTELEAASRSRR